MGELAFFFWPAAALLLLLLVIFYPSFGLAGLTSTAGVRAEEEQYNGNNSKSVLSWG